MKIKNTIHNKQQNKYSKHTLKQLLNEYKRTKVVSIPKEDKKMLNQKIYKRFF